MNGSDILGEQSPIFIFPFIFLLFKYENFLIQSIKISLLKYEKK